MIITNSWTGGTKDEYETQLFGFSADRLKIATRELIESNILSGIDDMESYLVRALDTDDGEKIEVNSFCSKLKELYCERAEPHLKIIDEHIDKLMTIPQHVLLAEDEDQVKQVSDDEYEKLKGDIATLKKRFEAAAIMESILNTEIEQCKSTEVCDVTLKTIEALDFLHKSSTVVSKKIQSLDKGMDLFFATLPFLKNNALSNDHLA